MLNIKKASRTICNGICHKSQQLQIVEIRKMVSVDPGARLFSIPDGSFKTFESYTVKFSAKETKWTSLEARTHPSFLETLISN